MILKCMKFHVIEPRMDHVQAWIFFTMMFLTFSPIRSSNIFIIWLVFVADITRALIG